MMLRSVRHLAMGAGLGTFLALFIIIANDAIFRMIVASSFPGLGVLGFVGLTASLIAVGCAITGFIFDAAERE